MIGRLAGTVSPLRQSQVGEDSVHLHGQRCRLIGLFVV